VYTAFCKVALLKVPEGADQVPKNAEPVKKPLNCTVFPEQIVWFVPAEILAARFTVTFKVETAGLQGPAPSGSFVVNVS
jgi:hypothetical protein